LHTYWKIILSGKLVQNKRLIVGVGLMGNQRTPMTYKKHPHFIHPIKGEGIYPKDVPPPCGDELFRAQWARNGNKRIKRRIS
jgi:hypothetical protein